MELKSARLTVLIAPSIKDAFEAACREVDMTPSQVVRRLIRDFVQEQAAAPGTARTPKPRAKR